jgi:hypothetical protein
LGGCCSCWVCPLTFAAVLAATWDDLGLVLH